MHAVQFFKLSAPSIPEKTYLSHLLVKFEHAKKAVQNPYGELSREKLSLK
jgi:hypothetical protein